MIPSERKFYIFRFCRWWCWLFMKLYNRYEPIGADVIPAEGACIVVANHVSFMDPPALGCGPMHRAMRFMARSTLYKEGFADWLFTNLATIPLSRDKGDLTAMRKALLVLKEGGCLGLFPEGTRTPDGTLQPAKSGIGFLIAKAGVPVIPAYIDGTFAALSRQSRFIKPVKIRVKYGRPITPAEIAALGQGRDCYEKAAKLVTEKIAALRDELRK